MQNMVTIRTLISIVVLALFSLSMPQISFAWNDGGSFFFPTQYNSVYTQPQEQLMVNAFGPTAPNSYNTNAIGSYQPGYSHNGSYYPEQRNFASQQPTYTNTNPYQSGSYNTMQNANVYNYPAQFGYASQPSYQQYQQPYPSNTYNGYSNGGYNGYGSGYTAYDAGYGYTSGYGSNYGGGYGSPTGGTNFWGTPLCNWGYDYQGYPCDRDPHQWVFDPHTGSYY